ncbi:MAG: phosphoribosyltransferase [Limisphaerales bacterium]|jgi:hypoxanthine phosphoribosyltransferase
MGQSPFITLSWADFQEALKLLSATLSSRSFSCIYGVPRGGLPLAVALSHRLDIPLSLEPAADMLWCDDIIDAGTTYLQARQAFPQATFCAWVAKKFHSELIYALDLSHKSEWILFPWESADQVLVEKKKYLAKSGKKLI